MATHAVDLGVITTSQLVPTVVDGHTIAPSVLEGWSIAETTGSAAAKVRIRDGATIAGPIRSGLIELTGGGTVMIFPEPPLELVNGALFIEVVSGSSVEPTIYWR